MEEFSETLMDHFASPRNWGTLDAPDVIGLAGTLGQGPFFVLYLRLSGETVADVRFRTYGCGATIAAGSMLTELITGQPLANCRTLTVQTLIEALDGVPQNKLHSPALAIAALKNALVKVDEATS